jgi:hypothetical protein
LRTIGVLNGAGFGSLNPALAPSQPDGTGHGFGGTVYRLIGANQQTPGETLVFVSDFSIAPPLAGIDLVLVAGVFQFGRRLQRDTEGLI